MKILVYDPVTEKYFMVTCKREKKSVIVILHCMFGGRFIDNPLISHMDNITIPGVTDQKFIFNFAKGRVDMQVLNSNTQQLVFGRNIAAPEDIYKTDMPVLLVNGSFRKEILKLFEEAWGKPLPYTSSNITADKLVLMTMFMGYSERFYNALPLDMKTGHICGEYRHVAGKIHKAENIIPLVSNAAIPQTKGVRRIIFQNEALVFYIPLLEWMWKVNGDTKDFVSCLEAVIQYNYEPLVYLSGHSEDIKNCIERFRQFTGISFYRVLMVLHRYPDYFSYYNSLSKERRKTEEKTIWRKLKNSHLFHREIDISDEIISRPLMSSTEFDIYTSGAFSFVPCNSLKQLRTTGRYLHNCLSDTKTPDIIFDKVFTAYRYNKPVGAVEVGNGKILQCRAADNKGIHTVPGFPDAVKQFAAKNNLEYTEHRTGYPYYNPEAAPPLQAGNEQDREDIWDFEHLLDELDDLFL